MKNFGRYLAVTALCLMLGTGVFIGLLSFAKRQDQSAAIAKAVCESSNQNTATLKNLLIFFEGQTLRNPHLTTQQRGEVVTFYAAAIKTLPTPPNRC